MKHKEFTNNMSRIMTIGMFLLTGCSFNPDFGIPSPVVSEGTIYFYTICHFNAVDAKTGEMRWKLETVKGKKEHVCKEHE